MKISNRGSDSRQIQKKSVRFSKSSGEIVVIIIFGIFNWCFGGLVLNLLNPSSGCSRWRLKSVEVIRGESRGMIGQSKTLDYYESFHYSNTFSETEWKKTAAAL